MFELPKIEDFKRKHYCRCCGCLYGSDAPRTYICPACLREERVRAVMECRVQHDPNVKVGVGSGGNQVGSNNHSYNENSRLHGFRLLVKGYSTSHYKEMARRLWGPKCVICGSLECIHVHHINFDKTDNSSHNIVPVCERCHNNIHSKRRMPASVIEEKFFSVVPNEIVTRLEHLKKLESDDGTIPEKTMLYLGALYIVKSGLGSHNITSASRSNKKQLALIKGLENSCCKCAACHRDSEDELVLTFVDGNLRNKVSSNLTMLCKECYNNIIGKYRTYGKFIEEAEVKSRNEAGNLTETIRTEDLTESGQGQSIGGEKI